RTSLFGSVRWWRSTMGGLTVGNLEGAELQLLPANDLRRLRVADRADERESRKLALLRATGAEHGQGDVGDLETGARDRRPLGGDLEGEDERLAHDPRQRAQAEVERLHSDVAEGGRLLAGRLH